MVAKLVTPYYRMIAVKLKGIEEKDTNVLQWEGMRKP